MSAVLDPFRFVVITVAGWMNQRQLSADHSTDESPGNCRIGPAATAPGWHAELLYRGAAWACETSAGGDEAMMQHSYA